MDSLLPKVAGALRAAGAPGEGETVVVGLSGGGDSVALLDLLTTLSSTQRFHVVAAHFDHRLRPTSGEDAAFCGELCTRLGVPLETGVAEEGDIPGGGEAAARLARYAFLRGVRHRRQARWLAVGHTRDDQAETVVLRLLRGSGSLGLGAMRPRSGDLLRPLLGVGRAELRAHLAERGLQWREDPTNADTTRGRSRVRHELLPVLAERFNPRVSETLARAADLLAEEAALIDRLVHERGLGPRDDAHGGVYLDREVLCAADKALARAAIRRALALRGGLKTVSASHVDRVLVLARRLRSSGRRVPLPGRREAWISFDRLVIGPAVEPAEAFARPLAVPDAVTLPGGQILRVWDAKDEVAEAAAPDGRALVVRTRRPGDRVVVRGRDRSLRRVLVEQRVPSPWRDRSPLLAYGSQVVWFAGIALDVPARGRQLRVILEAAL